SVRVKPMRAKIGAASSMRSRTLMTAWSNGHCVTEGISESCGDASGGFYATRLRASSQLRYASRGGGPKMNRLVLALAALIGAATLVLPAPVRAQAYPSQPVK